ncbi:MAG TPA: hypothetical protein VD866_26095, partial [Urbifossiella sp.]|nr:hypothetical protein [Urbifossiella sp.]
NPKPPADRTELEARYEGLHLGVAGPEAAGFMGKAGAALTGYSTVVVKRKPTDAAGAVAAGETDRYWASADGTSAVRIVFGADGRARLVELLTITPMGPPPPPPPEPVVPPAP